MTIWQWCATGAVSVVIILAGLVYLGMRRMPD